MNAEHSSYLDHHHATVADELDLHQPYSGPVQLGFLELQEPLSSSACAHSLSLCVDETVYGNSLRISEEY